MWPSTPCPSFRSKAISRATFGAPAGRITPPQTIASISLEETLVLSSKPRTASSASPMVSMRVNSPKARTNGVRAPATMTARRLADPVMAASLLASQLPVYAGAGFVKRSTRCQFNRREKPCGPRQNLSL
ncbi:Uncharacterised protein [Mycobacteroides abscessus subsp. abscessus]|nr:Uncharacterised protein [Mycobacteroides abscessus subsp. abscessus]